MERCLRSINQQTYRPLKIIIVNDGSTDNFLEVIKNLSLNLDFKVINQKNLGAAAARNRGFKESSGEYVIFWDADTVAKPEMLAKLASWLGENPNASYAYSQFRFGWKKFNCQPFNGDDLKRYNYIDTTSLIRREALINLPTINSGPFDESLARFQDWDLWLTLLEQNKTGIFIAEVLNTKIVQGRKGISSWLPKLSYQLPWKSRRVKEYAKARKIILIKHHLSLI